MESKTNEKPGTENPATGDQQTENRNPTPADPNTVVTENDNTEPVGTEPTEEERAERAAEAKRVEAEAHAAVEQSYGGTQCSREFTRAVREYDPNDPNIQVAEDYTYPLPEELVRFGRL